MRSLFGFLLASLVLALATSSPANAVTITEFPLAAGSAPRYIHPGPDGNLWFAESGTSSGIERISTTGEFITPIPDSNGPVDLVTLPDGTVLWTGDSGYGSRSPDGKILMRDSAQPFYAIALMPDGTPRFTGSNDSTHKVCHVTSLANLDFGCVGEAPSTRLTGLALDATGRMWATAPEANVIYRLGTNDFHDVQVDLPAGSAPARMVLASDGNLWVTMHGASAVDRITPSGTRLPRFELPPGSGPNDITVGPDGALWIAELDAGRIDRMTLDGTVTNKFTIPTPGSQPIGITTGPDGAIWFTESATGKIGRLQLDPATGGGGGGGLVDKVPPSFTHGVSLSNRRFRVAAGRTPVSARKVPKGTVLSFSLSEPAKASIVIARKAAGRRVGRACRAPSHSNHAKRHCTRYVKAGTLTRQALAGLNTVKFTGRIGRRALRPGAYRATVTATDAAGNSSKHSSAGFTIVR